MNGYELLAQYEKQIKECFYMPNEKLPRDFQDNRSDGVSLADLEKQCDERDSDSYHVQCMEARQARIPEYAAAVARGEPIPYRL